MRTVQELPDSFKVEILYVKKELSADLSRTVFVLDKMVICAINYKHKENFCNKNYQLYLRYHNTAI